MDPRQVLGQVTVRRQDTKFLPGNLQTAPDASFSMTEFYQEGEDIGALSVFLQGSEGSGTPREAAPAPGWTYATYVKRPIYIHCVPLPPICALQIFVYPAY